MKIAWFCIPAHGHTNPTLGLVQAMTAAGHKIDYFSFENFREKIEQAGAHFISCDDCHFEMEDQMGEPGSAARVGKDLAFATELIVTTTLALDDMIAQKIQELQPDMIISDSVAYWGKLMAMKYQIPYVCSTTTFAFNRYSAGYIKRGLGELFKMLVSMPKIKRQIRRLQDQGYPVQNILEIIQNDNDTNTIVYTSKYYQPCSETFSERFCFIGPSIRPIETPIKKTAEKTIFISMGTVIQNQALYSNCIEALKTTNYQVILSLGSQDPNSVHDAHFDNLPAQIQVYPSVDQMAVLSISDVFLTHCGMNSASEGLYFEVPLILCPQTPEQWAVAKRTKELGAGILLKSIQKTDILAAVYEILQDSKYKQAAQKISASFRESGGIERAKDFLEKLNK